jgi:interleukin-1 receptor-associated kinase 1
LCAGEEVLEWEERYRIAVGICKALEYIHDGSPQPVIHMNVKPSNILLSHDLRPQVLPAFDNQNYKWHTQGAEFT